MKTTTAVLEVGDNKYSIIAENNICYLQISDKVNGGPHKIVTITEVTPQVARNHILRRETEEQFIVNKWNVLNDGLKKIVFSDDLQLGYVIELPDGLSYDDLPFAHLEDVCEYFREVGLTKTLESVNSSLDFVKLQFGMTREKLNIFLRYANQIKKVTDQGIGIEMLCFSSLSLERLEKILNLAGKLPDALRFVSTDQILGSIRQPLAIPDGEQPVSHIPAISTGCDSYNGVYKFSSDGTVNRLTINETACTFKVESLSEEQKRQLDEKCERVIPTQFIHDWKVFHDVAKDGKLQTYYYNRAQGSLLLCEHDKDFPIEKAMKDNEKYLGDHYLYFREKRFLDFMKYKGHDLLKMMEQGRITQSRAHELCVHEPITQGWMHSGMTCDDFLKVPENHLRYIFQNSSKLEPALEFVSIFEMLNLKEPPLQTWSYLGVIGRPLANAVNAVARPTLGVNIF